MQKIADKCVELIEALKQTYQESSIPQDIPFRARFLDSLKQYIGRDHWEVAEELYGDMPSKSQTEKETAHIAVACLLADMAFNIHKKNPDKALDYLCRAYLAAGWAINSTVEPRVLKRERTNSSRNAANARHQQGKIVRQYAEQLVRTWAGDTPLTNPSNAARSLKKAVNDYAIERFRNATDPSDPFYNKSDPRVLATGEDKGKAKDPYSERTLRGWFKGLDFEQ
ncbi:hypothetical protein PWP93_11125 [Paraburkholderia sp. A1RI-2L]|uniref:hypothetical protein n=1 Tax=Paraburkholderia sp. A1RI-2L TaxID=3028367 RepID=UPI003B7D2CDA